ncbi:hypothetical protein K501DRAFT_277021 [Backusella circina FSU 941]|nr:hypothetical protein K501DRAFT_277021 [Backusella circina FSU 941]
MCYEMTKYVTRTTITICYPTTLTMKHPTYLTTTYIVELNSLICSTLIGLVDLFMMYVTLGKKIPLTTEKEITIWRVRTEKEVVVAVSTFITNVNFYWKVFLFYSVGTYKYIVVHDGQDTQTFVLHTSLASLISQWVVDPLF